MKESRYIYFISDVHLGLNVGDPTERERRLLKVLQNLPKETRSIYLLGDIFDFWFEYKYVVPKGFVRILGELASLSDRGVEIYFFKGNHDVWTFGYLEKELGLKLLTQPSFIKIEDQVFCIGHGDGLGKGEYSYKILRWIFHNRLLQKLFSILHPKWAFYFAHNWSSHNRLSKGVLYKFRGEDDRLYKFATSVESRTKVDYFIFGHIHSPGEIKTPNGASFYILGEWIHGCEYLEYDTITNSMRWLSGLNE